MATLRGCVGGLGDASTAEDKGEDLDERTRRNHLAVLQYLQDHELWESLAAMERETGLSYAAGSLPSASLLEGSLDMFAAYWAPGSGEAEEEAKMREAEEALLRLERGICCTGPCSVAMGPTEPLSANVTAVAWAGLRSTDFLALCATADRRLRLFGAEGEILAELSSLSSPLLGLDVDAFAAGEQPRQPVLATAMGGEVLLLWLVRPSSQDPDGADGGAGTWSLELGQRFKDHAKHATGGRFAPPAEEGQPSAHFVTVSRDHQANLYVRDAGDPVGAFSLAGSARFPGEVTCCCWASDRTFVLAVREDHHLHYWDVDGGGDAAGAAGPCERLKTNLNALGDSVVSFAVLAMAISPDRELIAVCTDKSRVIVLQAFTGRQLRNLYGAVVDEYDTPNVCFSHDRSFLYVTSSIPVRARRGGDEEFDAEAAELAAICGEVLVFEVRSGEVMLHLPCHRKPVRCLARHPHTEVIVTGSFDKAVKYWG